MKNKFLDYLGITIVVCMIVGSIAGLCYVIVGAIKQNPDKLVKEDSEYLYYKHYTLYNNDSCVYKYHKPIDFDGVIIRKTSHFQGVPGKGGHRVYHTYIKYDGDKEYMETGWSFYSNYNEGNHVIVHIEYYPFTVITIK